MDPESLPAGGQTVQENQKDQTTTDTTADRLVLSALALMRKQGYHKTTLEDIADDVCLPLDKVTDCFATKADLCLQVLDRHNEHLSEIFSKTEEQSNPRQRLSSLIDSLVDEGESLVKYGCPITRLFLDLKNESPELEQAATALVNRRLEWITEQFRLMSFVDEAPDLAARLTGALYGVTLLSSAAGDETILRNQLNQLKSWIRSM
ncbi:TetR/AcrR family transcriptional regulator [Emcibacter nanhaiensis]|uniref:TetR/AcrR family transcriptional regulator n=1 Tax=Emcibacter nanhaiensis TaxID=1505037 RepID=A0A501PQ24_9PROT|nr:TetR/AcrR family transcriptional regulator [Emcibacter nanhaiensis]